MLTFFFLKEWKRTKERDESKNNEFVYNFFFHKQKKETRVKREMRAKIMSLCLISFCFHKQKKKKI